MTLRELRDMADAYMAANPAAADLEVMTRIAGTKATPIEPVDGQSIYGKVYEVDGRSCFLIVAQPSTWRFGRPDSPAAQRAAAERTGEIRRHASIEINCEECGEMAGRPCSGGEMHASRLRFAEQADIAQLADPRAVAIRLVSEVRNALVPALRRVQIGGPLAPAAVAVRRVLDYTTQCAWWLEAS
jgi:hypothetical protein